MTYCHETSAHAAPQYSPVFASLLAAVKVMFPEKQWPAVWIVGGAVRDALTGKLARDIDLITTLPGEVLVASGFRHVFGKSTLPIFIRTQPDCGLVEVTCIADPAELTADLFRRDFTINAIALALDGELIDPCAGVEALPQKKLHVCSATVFRDDPLRLIRACRFIAEEWQPTNETKRLMQEITPVLLTGIPVERFSREMVKALAAPDPALFFSQLVACPAGIMYLPELYRMAKVPAGPLDKHPEGDLMTHSLQVLARVAELTSDPLTRFCAYFHDLGKLATDAAQYPRHHGHEDAGFAMAGDLCRRLRLPTRYGCSLAWICRLHGKANRWPELRLSTRLTLAEQALKAGIQGMIPLIAGADKEPGTTLTDWETILTIALLSATELAIPADQLNRLPAKSRTSFIRQARLIRLRRLLA